jgi:hypothetical protein
MSHSSKAYILVIGATTKFQVSRNRSIICANITYKYRKASLRAIPPHHNFFLFIFVETLHNYLFFRNTNQNFTKGIFCCGPQIHFSNVVPTKPILHFYLFQSTKPKKLIKTLPNQPQDIPTPKTVYQIHQ